MAERAHTTSGNARAIPLLAKAQVAAIGQAAEVKAVAEYLADVMTRVHGGSFRIQIDHESRLVVVAQTADKRPTKPKPEVAG